MAQAIVYVDGFNLYYGAVRNTPYKWLDIDAVCRMLLRDEISQIRYFTARISGRPHDPQAPQRQETYLRALRTIPHLTPYFGQFREWPERQRLVTPISGQTHAEVLVTKEKGSDVNLATHLMYDGLTNPELVSVVISNDSDLVAPISLLVGRGHSVGVINPHPPKKASRELRAAASFYKQLRESVLQACQFPNPLRDGEGTFGSPWS